MDFNPWAVENVEAFHYYCCPECELRYQSCQEFQEHAIHQHPKAKTLFQPVKIIETIKCAECGESFENNALYKKHYYKAHGITILGKSQKGKGKVQTIEIKILAPEEENKVDQTEFTIEPSIDLSIEQSSAN